MEAHQQVLCSIVKHILFLWSHTISDMDVDLQKAYYVEVFDLIAWHVFFLTCVHACINVNIRHTL